MDELPRWPAGTSLQVVLRAEARGESVYNLAEVQRALDTLANHASSGDARRQAGQVVEAFRAQPAPAPRGQTSTVSEDAQRVSWSIVRDRVLAQESIPEAMNRLLAAPRSQPAPAPARKGDPRFVDLEVEE